MSEQIELNEQTNPLKGWLGLAEKTAKQVLLAPSDTNLLVRLLLADAPKEYWEKVMQQAKMEVPICAIMLDRLEASGFIALIDPRIVLLLGTQLGKPGSSVLWAYTLAALQVRNNQGVYTLEHLCEDFGSGFPHEDAPETAALWLHQKGSTHNFKVDNLLDYSCCWPQPIKA